MSVEVTIDRSRLERILRAPNGIVSRTLRRRTDKVARRARQLAPGSMARMITSEVTTGTGGLVGVVTCHHHATQYVIWGTRPHTIRPRRRRALRFQAGGRTVFADVVHHPGNAPNNFLARALREAS